MKGVGFLQRQLGIGLVVILLVVCAAIASSVTLMMATFESTIAPQMLAKAMTAGRTLSSLFGQAASYDIPLEKLVGVDTLFADAAKKHPELARFELLQNGKVFFGHGAASATPSTPGTALASSAAEITTTIPIAGYESAATRLKILVDPHFIRKVFEEMTLDLAVVVVVTLFISLELLYFMAGSLVADLAKLSAQLAALSRGAFVVLPGPAWLGVGFSRALADRVRSMAARYRQTLADLSLLIQTRHDVGAQHGRQSVRLAIAALRKARAEFSFTDTHGSRGGRSTEGALLLGSMRAPFFLLLLADDLSRSFLPIFATELSVGPLPISPNLVASLPIFLFMLIVALSQPLLGGWSERMGRRHSFLVGAAVACIAHLLAAQSTTLLELLIWRSAGGAAWAIGFVAAQGYVLDTTDSKNRTAGLAAFVGIIMVSLICGPSIGGLLADGLGHRWTMALGSLLTATSFALAWRRLPRDQMNTTGAMETAGKLKWGEKPNTKNAGRGGPHIAQMLTNRRFLMLLLCAAVPAKIILIAYCYYLIPLYVMGSGSSSAMAGRLIMLYSVIMVLLVPITAGWVASLRVRHYPRPEALFVSAGLALSGLAGLAMALPLPASVGLLGPFLVVLMLGLGQALSISPQAAMVAELCQNEIRRLGQSVVYGVYRMIERMGNAIGPLIAAALLEIGGFGTAFVTIGIAVLCCAALFAWVFLRSVVAVAPLISGNLIAASDQAVRDQAVRDQAMGRQK